MLGEVLDSIAPNVPRPAAGRPRDVLEHLHWGELAVQRLGAVLPHERVRILDGDHSPLEREFEPAFVEGDTEVLAWSKERRDYHADYDEITVHAAQPVFTIAVTGCVWVRRTRLWAVRFNVFDRRQSTRFIRRKPPGGRGGSPWRQPGESKRRIQAVPVSEERARQESSYTPSPANAIDNTPAVSDDELARQRERSDANWAVRQAAERRKERAKTLGKRLSRAEAQAASLGLDAKPLLDDVEQRIKDFYLELEAAA